MQDLNPEWLIQARKGDDYAFARIVETYQKPVFSLCYRMLGNAEDAEDAAQETFLRAYKSIKKYDQKRSFSTWILSIGAHYCIDQIRKRRFKLVSIEELPVPELPDRRPGVESIISKNEEQQKVRKLLEHLSPTDRACVVMYYWHDFSYDEICQALSLTPSALKSRLHRARRAMAKIWSDNVPNSFVPERMAP